MGFVNQPPLPRTTRPVQPDTSTELTRLIRQLYDLPRLRIELVGHGVNQTYRVHVADKRMFFRLYSSNPYFGTNRDDFLFELKLLVHLAERGLPVPTPIPTREGRLLAILELLGQHRYGALFPSALGSPHRAWWPTIRDEIAIRELGTLFARMHAAADCFCCTYERYEFDLSLLLQKPMALLRSKMEDRGRAREMMRINKTANDLQHIIDSLGKESDVYGIIHGDAHVGNVLYDDNVGYTLIDFDHCAFGWRVYDLVPLFNTLEINVSDTSIVNRVRELVLAGYESVRPLSQVERDAIPTFQFLWYMWDIGESLTLSSTWGGPIEGEAETQTSFLNRAVSTLEQATARYVSS